VWWGCGGVAVGFAAGW